MESQGRKLTEDCGISEGNGIGSKRNEKFSRRASKTFHETSRRNNLQCERIFRSSYAKSESGKQSNLLDSENFLLELSRSTRKPKASASGFSESKVRQTVEDESICCEHRMPKRRKRRKENFCWLWNQIFIMWICQGGIRWCFCMRCSPVRKMLCKSLFLLLGGARCGGKNPSISTRMWKGPARTCMHANLANFRSRC